MITVDTKLGCRSRGPLSRIGCELRQQLAAATAEAPPARLQALLAALVRRLEDPRRQTG